MRRDFGCLGSLTGGQQRLLALRSGVDGGHAHSRAAVARILHVSRPREARLERGALRDLVAEARQGCSQTTVTDSFVVFNASQRSAMVGWITGTPTSDTTDGTTDASTGSDANRAGADSQADGVTRAGAHQRSHARHRSTVPANIDVGPVGGGTPVLPILLGLAALILGAVFFPVPASKPWGAQGSWRNRGRGRPAQRSTYEARPPATGDSAAAQKPAPDAERAEAQSSSPGPPPPRS